MDSLEKSTQLLAVQVADMLLPAVSALTEMFRTAAGVVAGLDPEVKKQISTFAIMAVQVAVAAKAFSLFSGLAANVFGVLKGGFSLLAAVGTGPMLGIVAAIGLVIGAVLLLHRTWRKNWGGIQEATASVLSWLQEGFGQFATFMGKVWDFLVDGAASFVDGLLLAVDTVQAATGAKLIDTNALREGFGGLWKDLKSGSFFTEAFSFGKTIGGELVDGIKEEWAAIKDELGFDKLMRPGKTIALGRGMQKAESQGGKLDWREGDTASDSAAAKLATDLEESGRAAWDIRVGIEEQNANDYAEAARQTNAAYWASIDQQVKDSEAQTAAAQAAADKVKATFSVIAGAVTGALGEVGQLVNTAISAASTGGPWAALVAVIMEVVSKTASAMEFVDTAMAFVMQIAEMIEPLVKPIFDVLTDVLGMIISMIGPLIDAFKPFFDSFVSSIQNLMPVFLGIGQVLQALAPIIKMIGGVVDMLTKAAAPIFELIGGALKAVATIILGIVIGFNELAAAFGDTKAREEADRLKEQVSTMWAPGADELAIANGKAAGSTLRNAKAQERAAEAAEAESRRQYEAMTTSFDLSKYIKTKALEVFDIGGQAFAEGSLAGAEAARAFVESVLLINGATAEAAAALGQAAYDDFLGVGTAAAAAANGLNELTGALSNVPTGFKVEAARYQADMGSGGFAPGGGAQGGGGVTIIGDITVMSSADNLLSLAVDAKQEAMRYLGQRRGNSTKDD
jgi:hypothetical protein